MECKIEGCNRITRSLGLCRTHYRRYHDGTPMDAPIQTQRRISDITQCSVNGCQRPGLRRNGLCRACDDRIKRGSSKELPVYQDHFIDANGYIRLNKTHHLYPSDNPTRQPPYMHRIVMEIYLGRSLVDKENIHHINGDRSDNRLENLELWNTSQPSGQRAQDKVTWAKEILELYGH